MNLNLFAPMNELGYGVHSYNTARALEKIGYSLRLFPPFGQVSRSDEHIERWMRNRRNFSKEDLSLMMFQDVFLAQFCGRKRIGFPVFETEKFSPESLAMLRSCDVLLTPSEWGKNILASEVPGVPCYVVHEGFDPEIFYPDQSTSDKVFTFVHVGKFEERKGTLQVLRCFANAFTREDVNLRMHVDNPFTEDYSKIISLLHSLNFSSVNGNITWHRLGQTIRFTNRTPVHSQIASLYRSADYGIFPSRAEGWGLPILECLASGVPALVGNWTGQSEYLKAAEYPDELTLDRFTRAEAKDDVWFHGGQGDWNIPTNENLTEKIRWAFNKGMDFKKSDKWKASHKKLFSFTWDAAAQMLDAVLREIS